VQRRDDRVEKREVRANAGDGLTERVLGRVRAARGTEECGADECKAATALRAGDLLSHLLPRRRPPRRWPRRGRDLHLHIEETILASAVELPSRLSQAPIDAAIQLGQPSFPEVLLLLRRVGGLCFDAVPTRRT